MSFLVHFRRNAIYFSEKDFIFMVFLAVTDARTASFKAMQKEISFASSYKNDLNDVSSGIFNSQKVHEDKISL